MELPLSGKRSGGGRRFMLSNGEISPGVYNRRFRTARLRHEVDGVKRLSSVGVGIEEKQLTEGSYSENKRPF